MPQIIQLEDLKDCILCGKAPMFEFSFTPCKELSRELRTYTGRYFHGALILLCAECAKRPDLTDALAGRFRRIFGERVAGFPSSAN